MDIRSLLNSTVTILTLCALFIIPAGLQAQNPASPEEQEEQRVEMEGGQVVRLLSPPGRLSTGKTEIDVLVIDPEIRELVFFVDDVEMDRRKKLPWRGKVDLESPARRQTVTVKAYGAKDRLLGEDSVEVNRIYRPFRVGLTDLTGVEGEYLQVQGKVSMPYGAELDRVDIYVGDTPLATLRQAEFAGRITHPVQKGDVVRAEARLQDGRKLEDVRIFGVANVERAETFLVQLQVLVNHRNGPPIQGLKQEDFKVFEDGKERPVDRLMPAGDVALSLGLVVDSSGSMQRIWPATRRAVRTFLDSVVGQKDQVFLTSFADHVRLEAELTPDPTRIDQAMAAMQPDGITALYDSIVFSMLQFGDRPGRRALVVISDGADHGSHTEPSQGVEFGRLLGIPVYVVAIQADGGASSFGQMKREAPIHALKLLTDPTGGRLLRTNRRGGLQRSFKQIGDELRSQYLLTFYTDRPLDDDLLSRIEIQVPGRKKVDVRAVLAWDQVR